MEAIFDWLQMDDFRDVLGSKMSTGMKQKVSIARTIVHDPPVLIFDEPTSGLDVLVARVVLQKIAELRDQGKTIVFSTHAMHEVEKLCSRVAIIHKGRVQAEGEPAELLERFGQPDLEELFFHLVERADAGGRPPAVDRAERATRPMGSPHALAERLDDLPPRGPRPAPRPPDAVHGLRPAAPALPDPGDRDRAALGGVRAEAADGGRRRGRAPAAEPRRC